MKRSLLLVAAVTSVFQLCGQGTMQLTSGATINTNGVAYLVLNNMHLVNNGTFQQSIDNGEVKFTGTMDVNISGSSATSINNLILSKVGMSNLNLLSNIYVLRKVNFSGGLLNLNNNVLDLGTSGEFSNESAASRAYTTGSGYAQATGMLNNPSFINLGKLGASITTTNDMGNTVIKRGHKVQTAITGSNNSILRYYDIEPTNNSGLKATLRFHYFDPELNGIAEASLHQYRSKDMTSWAFVGADSRNTIDNYVEQKNLSKFDRLTLATAAAPIISCPANITTTSNAKGCKASVSFTATATAGVPPPTITYMIGNTAIVSPYLFSKGITTVTATASNQVLPNSSCTFTVTVHCGNASNNLVTGSDQTAEFKANENLSLLVRPNPSNTYFIIDLKSNDLQNISLRVMDVSGRLIETRKDIGVNSTIYLGHRYSTGVYFVEAIQGKERVIYKLIKSGN